MVAAVAPTRRSNASASNIGAASLSARRTKRIGGGQSKSRAVVVGGSSANSSSNARLDKPTPAPDQAGEGS